MVEFAAMSRTTIEGGGVPVVMGAELTEHQTRIFVLLEAESPVWNRKRSQWAERDFQASERPNPCKIRAAGLWGGR